MRRHELLCEDRLAEEIEVIARERGLSREAVIRQVIDAGLDELGR